MKDIEYAAPRSIAEAVQLLNERGDRARILAGGTDLIVQVREYRRDLDVMVDVKRVPEATALTFDAKSGLRIGAATPLCRIYEHADVKARYPGLIDAASLVGGIQIQSRATLGGNLCNASPAGDTIPALIALDATCVVVGSGGTRELPVADFCLAPGKTALQSGEFLLALQLPAPKPRSGAAYLRFIPRNEMDIAVVGVGVAVELDAAQTRAVSARVALAAVAPRPLNVAEAAAVLTSGPWSDALMEQAAAKAQAAATPISDMRGDADYRKHLVAVLVKRALGVAVQRARGN